MHKLRQIDQVGMESFEDDENDETHRLIRKATITSDVKLDFQSLASRSPNDSKTRRVFSSSNVVRDLEDLKKGIEEKSALLKAPPAASCDDFPSPNGEFRGSRANMPSAPIISGVLLVKDLNKKITPKFLVYHDAVLYNLDDEKSSQFRSFRVLFACRNTPDVGALDREDRIEEVSDWLVNDGKSRCVQEEIEKNDIVMRSTKEMSYFTIFGMKIALLCCASSPSQANEWVAKLQANLKALHSADEVISIHTPANHSIKRC